MPTFVPVEHDPFAGPPIEPYSGAADRDPWEVAAERIRQSVKPRSGRAERMLTGLPEDTAPPKASFAALMAGDMANLVPAASQRTSPHISDYDGKLVSTETFEDDGGNILFRDPQTGELNYTDNSKHVAIRDPTDGVVKVFARSDATNERPITGLARVLASGMAVGPVTARPVIAAVGELRAAQSLAREAEPLASRSPNIYNPPVKSPRPFEADYPAGARADAQGRLTHDIDGRELTARTVVGRRMVGGNDEALPAAQFNPLAEATTGRRSQVVPPREIGGDAGRVILDRRYNRPENILLNRTLPPQISERVFGHELGHVVDRIAGGISTKGLSEELKAIYNTLNNLNRSRDGLEAASWGKTFRPQDLGYKGGDIGREYMAEAIRAYMADPNYLKTVGPETARRIREFVNANPSLSRHIQFNSALGPLAAGGAIGSLELIPVDHDPFEQTQ